MELVKSVWGLGRVYWYQKGGGILLKGVMRRVSVLELGSGSSKAARSSATQKVFYGEVVVVSLALHRIAVLLV